MKTRLINISKSLIDIDGKELTPEEQITYVARVSSPQNQENMASAPKLLKYLIANSHWSPFELVHMTVEIQTSRAIAAQILRHRSFSFSEFSQRYSVASELEIAEARRQDVKNRQNSIDDLDDNTKTWFRFIQQKLWDAAQKEYQHALSLGISKESSRFLLPLNTQTTLFMSGSIRSWIHYLELRSSSGTQVEHKDIANEIIETIFIPNFPSVSEALTWTEKGAQNG